MPRNDLIQYRRGTAEQWAAVNPVLADGEVGFDRTNSQIRVGDAARVWSDLEPIGGISGEAVAAAVSEYLASHPLEGVTPETLEAALQAHREEEAPHRAY